MVSSRFDMFQCGIVLEIACSSHCVFCMVFVPTEDLQEVGIDLRFWNNKQQPPKGAKLLISRMIDEEMVYANSCYLRLRYVHNIALTSP